MAFILIVVLSLLSLTSTEIVDGIEVKKHTTFVPKLFNPKRSGFEEVFDTRDFSQKRTETGHFVHKRNIDVSLTLFEEEYILNLRLNEDLFSPNYHVIYGAETNNITYGVENCYYVGSVEKYSQSIISVKTCDNILEGMIRTQEETFLLTNQKEKRGGEYQQIAFKKDDVLNEEPYECALHPGERIHFDFDHSHKRSNDQPLYFPPLPETPLTEDHTHQNKKRATNRYIEFLAVNDFKRVQDHTAAKVSADTALIVNAVSQIYLTGTFSSAQGSLIVRLIGQYVPTSEEFDPTSTKPDISNLLDTFCAWRTSRLGKTTDALGVNDNAQLFSGRDLVTGTSSSPAGLAWLGSLCSSTYSCGVSEALLSRNLATTSQIVAHEMAHNLNSDHDGTGNPCPSSGALMSPFICSGCNQFSSCSITAINNFLTTTTCMTNEPTVGKGTCGNHVVDPGEDCDVGPFGTQCCNGNNAGANSCKWTTGSECDFTTNMCCNTGCKFRPNTYLCRANYSSCDLPDYCSGTGSCVNQIRPNGDTCSSSSNPSVCSSGDCVSRVSQCNKLNGYSFFINGKWVQGPYVPCGSSDCALRCQSSTGECIDASIYNFPNDMRFVAFGLPCTCNGVGRCTGSSNTCTCTSATTTATRTPTPTPTPTPTATICSTATITPTCTAFTTMTATTTARTTTTVRTTSTVRVTSTVFATSTVTNTVSITTTRGLTTTVGATTTAKVTSTIGATTTVGVTSCQTPTPTPTLSPTSTVPTYDSIPLFCVANRKGMLRASYYENDLFTYPPIFVGTETNFDFNWGPGKPLQNMTPIDKWAISYTGIFRPTVTGPHIFRIDSNDGGRINLEGVRIAGKFINQNLFDGSSSNPIMLDSGHPYPFSIDFFENTEDARLLVQVDTNGKLENIKPENIEDCLLIPPPIPTTSMCTTNTPGMNVKYFQNSDFTNLVIDRQENPSTFVYNFGSGTPNPQITNPDNFSIRWSFVMSVPTLGGYQIGITSPDAIQVRIQGITVINSSDRNLKTKLSPGLRLEANRFYFVEVELSETFLTSSLSFNLTQLNAGQLVVPTFRVCEPQSILAPIRVSTTGMPSASVPVSLRTAPTANVIVSVTSDGTGSFSPNSLTFTPSNWNVPQVITASSTNSNTPLNFATSSSHAPSNGLTHRTIVSGFSTSN